MLASQGESWFKECLEVLKTETSPDRLLWRWSARYFHTGISTASAKYNIHLSEASEWCGCQRHPGLDFMAFHGDLPADKYQVLNSVLTVTSWQGNPTGWRQLVWGNTVWDKRAEYTEVDRRVSNLFGNGELRKISEVVCDRRLWRWRFPIHFPRRHSCLSLSYLTTALKGLFFGQKPKQSCTPLSLPNCALPSLLTATNTPLFHWRWRLCSWKKSSFK